MDADNSDEESLNLFLPSHRDPIGDVYLVSRLELESGILFTNTWEVTHYLGPRGRSLISKTIGNFPDVVAVGFSRDFNQTTPTDKILKSLSLNISKNVINYPQGFTTNFHEILPLNRNFNKKLISPILAKNYKIKIIPISMEVDCPVLQDQEAVLRKKMVIKIVCTKNSFCCNRDHGID